MLMLEREKVECGVYIMLVDWANTQVAISHGACKKLQIGRSDIANE